ncbi:hypothetical protein R5W24_002339 [Gemmata sp. JC717]|uniref:OB-fold protein n=1 Tax=Gemmata algarum TaxID=2975278 RepID=UPI0021BA7ED9|nr:hypothetical protein [Gemmata algarum]MDY3553245.1 hypothetical protein [Gemmata algarum]
MRISMFVLGAFAVAAPAADEKPDFTLTAEAYAREYVTDKKAFATKYKGKTVELTATVWNMRLGSGDVLLNGKPDAKMLEAICFSALPSKLEDPLRSLSRGQAVTVRGKQADSRPGLVGCEFVKIGPSTAIPVTLAGAIAEFKKNATAAEKKFGGKSVVTRAKVVEVKADELKGELKLVVTDAAGKGATKVEAVNGIFTTLQDRKMVLEVLKLKAGDVVVLMGEPQFLANELRLDQIFLLKEPPPGVKLPGDKK